MLTKQIYKKLFKTDIGIGFRIIYWDGSEETYGTEPIKFTLKFNKEIPIKQILSDPSITLGEAYMHKDIDLISDDPFALEKIIKYAFEHKDKFLKNNKVGSLLPKKMTHSKKESKDYIAAHYDIGNDFYKLWLDPTMTYSGAYFAREDMTLEEAQYAKVEHILNKLNIQSGEKLLDIGCGWGTLIFTAAKKYGAHATGITLSEEQYHFVKAKIESEGLTDQMEVFLMDYRDLPKSSFDKISSVGMIEHVGKENIDIYFKTIHDLLVPKGSALIQGITGQEKGGTNSWFEKYIFPGGYMPGLAEVVTSITQHDLQLIDLESLRRHYQKTLEIWTENFHKQLDEISKTKDETFIRMWDLYLQSSAGSFASGNIDLIQYLMTKGVNNELPMTREYML